MEDLANRNMYERRFWTFWMIIIILSSVQSALGQKAGKIKVKPSEKLQNAKSDFDWRPFAVENQAKSLKPNYKGHDLNEIYLILQKRITAKGEFETTSEYETRVALATQKDIAPGFRLEDTFAFRKDIDASSAKYDADRELFALALRFSTASPKRTARSEGGAVKSESGVLGAGMLGERLERTDPNSGIQLFSLPLSRVDNLISKLNIENKSSFFPGVGRNSYETAIEIPVLREAAPAIKDQISFLFVGKLQRPFFGTYKDALGILGTPNMGGGRNLEVWLHFRLDEIIVFNRRSGEIVKRINSQSK